MCYTKLVRKIVSTLIFSLIVTPSNIQAVPPHPQLFDGGAAAKRTVPYFLQHLDEMHNKGICTADDFMKKKPNTGTASLSATAGTPFRVLAILVKFSDHDSSVTASYFDSLVFDSVSNTVRDYFSEISYGQLDLVTVNVPSSIGWQTAPQTYAYYVNGQNGTGAYPQNTQLLVENLVDMVDPQVNFSQYDNDGDQYVDVLLVIHSGSGAEFTRDSTDIWSHKWSISPRLRDGVYITDYTVQPEYWLNPGDMTIGVYAHELSHGLGLPDLYDTDYSSNGIGRWCIMSYGSWNGPYPGGGSPAHPSAWSRIQMGFAAATNVTANMNSVAIDNVNQNGTIYRLWTSGNIGNEYFLVENRQKIGYDQQIPASGLLIWHIDENKFGNTEEWYPGQPNANHYAVALEQADGLFEMEHNVNQGDGFDIFPGLGAKTSFNAVSSPNSDSYNNGTSFVAVDNINAIGNIVYVDLIVGFAAGIDDVVNETILPASVELAQNYPNPFNPSTNIQFTLQQSADVLLEVYNVKGKLTAKLLDGRYSIGTHAVTWDGRDRLGNEVASGVYFYRAVSNGSVRSKKMILLR